ncbi:FRG domain-containing protein [Methylobacterium sp. Leaf456]|uniref:FRG domain-containing protein n=1 Tax=Methylobacterium sp. Leaf456 TaxID=1736382 RepID=UPI0012E36BE6|nr:FRG domain-containing protein [Methylobacterium sp. Leaf456]
MAKPATKKSKKTSAEGIEITSVSQYISKIVELAPRSGIIRTYRGHAKTSYLLKPSLYRTSGNSREEKNILRELVSLHPSEFEKDRSAFDQLVRMQHFSLETRLFDVSLNHLVAL